MADLDLDSAQTSKMLRDRVAIITGASRGLGRGIALELARHGAAVVLAARTVEDGKGLGPGSIHSVAEEVRKLGGTAVPMQTDISNPDEINRLAEATVEQFGRIDILVNNAGIGVSGDTLTCTTEDWDTIMSVNLRAPFLGIRAVSGKMLTQGHGCIINVSSILAEELADDPSNPILAATAQNSGPGVTPYGVTKAGIIRLTRGAAADLKDSGISVSCLKPSWTDTEGLRAWFPEADRGSWSKPEDWGIAVRYVALADPRTTNGMIIGETELAQILSSMDQGALS